MNWKRIRWWAGSFLVLFLLITSGLLVNSFFQENESQRPGSNNPVSPTTPITPGSPTSPTDPAQGENGGEDHGGSREKSNSRDAVLSAGEAVQALSVAQLLPENLLRESVNSLVVSEKRAELTSALISSGPSFANVMGYQSVDDALINSEYVVRIEKYRIDKFDPSAGTAVVFLYTVSHFVTRSVSADNQVSWKAVDSPRINVIQMRWQDDRWLYVRRSDAPPGQAPVFTKDDIGLNYEQVVARFKPYLEKGGYQNYG